MITFHSIWIGEIGGVRTLEFLILRNEGCHVVSILGRRLFLDLDNSSLALLQAPSCSDLHLVNTVQLRGVAYLDLRDE